MVQQNYFFLSVKIFQLKFQIFQQNHSFRAAVWILTCTKNVMHAISRRANICFSGTFAK